MRLNRRLALGLGLAALHGPGRVLAADDAVVVFAAASLTEVLQTLAKRLAAPGAVRFSFAASSTLARQIEQGAPAHVFISADPVWMDYLALRGRISASRVLAGNRLVVVRPAGTIASRTPAAEDVDALRAALQPAPGPNAPQRVACGDPAHVPAGRYAQAALTHLGLWADVAPRLVRADNVRSALSFVERAEVAAGIVYATDAPIARGVQVVARFPAASHPPIRYPAALVAGAPPAARALLDALGSPSAQPVWRAAGFEAP